MFTTILLDVDNTLLDFNKGAITAIRQGFREFGIPWPEEFPAVFHTVNDRLWRQVELGTLTRDELFRIRFDRVFEAAGVNFDGWTFEGRFRQLLAESHEPVDGATEALRYLAGKYTVCVASNSSYDQQIRRLRDAGMLEYLSHVFVSEQAGAEKPSTAFFQWCFDQLGNTTKEETVMIGDSLTADLAGCEAFGIACCWFNYGGQPIPEDICPWKIIHSLNEIPAIL